MSLSRPRIFLSNPHMGNKELSYIEEAFKQNWVAPLGPNVDEFEKAISQFTGLKYAAVLSSGTAAIHLALIILGIQKGDEVIVPSFTFAATLNPVLYQNAIPILVDSEAETWNINPTLLETAIKDRLLKGKKPKAIIPVHLYGMPARMDKIMEISHKYDIPVVEDAAEALGSAYNGKSVGSYGEMGVLSFNGNKIITTSGGGALISNDEELISKARFLATQARDKAPYYQHSHVGFNYRMSNILAGIGRGQMLVLGERIKRRREIFFHYKKELANYEGIKFLEEPNDSFFSNHWLTTILVDPTIAPINIEMIQKELENENIESRRLWKPMHLQPIFSKYPAYLDGTSDALFQDGLCLPSGSSLASDEINRVITIIDSLYR